MDCNYCNNRGMRWGCRKCGVVSEDGKKIISDLRRTSDNAINRYIVGKR